MLPSSPISISVILKEQINSEYLISLEGLMIVEHVQVESVINL